MIDIKFLRENPEAVKENIRKKFQDSKLPLVDKVIELDEELRANKKKADELRANRNKVSKSIGALMGQKKFEEAEAAKKGPQALAEAKAFFVAGEFTKKQAMEVAKKTSATVEASIDRLLPTKDSAAYTFCFAKRAASFSFFTICLK